jgi:hypothetical protein
MKLYLILDTEVDGRGERREKNKLSTIMEEEAEDIGKESRRERNKLTYSLLGQRRPTPHVRDQSASRRTCEGSGRI